MLLIKQAMFFMTISDKQQKNFIKPWNSLVIINTYYVNKMNNKMDVI